MATQRDQCVTGESGMSEDIEIGHEPERARFAAYSRESQTAAVLRYRAVTDRTLDYYSTFTPVELRGRGIAGRLVAYALDYALTNDLGVIPTCPFVARIIAESPKYAPLVRRHAPPGSRPD